jgi:hypothetical protein
MLPMFTIFGSMNVTNSIDLLDSLRRESFSDLLDFTWMRDDPGHPLFFVQRASRPVVVRPQKRLSLSDLHHGTLYYVPSNTGSITPSLRGLGKALRKSTGVRDLEEFWPLEIEGSASQRKWLTMQTDHQSQS